MSHRSRGRRQGRASDPLDTVKPLVVLGLLGMIVYGAMTMVRSGPSTPPAVAGLDASAPLAPAAVDLPATPTAAPIFAASAPSPPEPTAPGTTAPEPSPTYLQAQAAPPPSATAAAPVPPPVPAPPPPMTAPVAAAPPTAPAPVPPSAAIPAPTTDGGVLPTARQAAAVAAGSTAFAAAWADAHDKLAAGQYAEALSLLSVWYDDPSLGPEETRRLDALLGQLAGTVIYSQQDFLLPAHVVSAGQTLHSIAAPLQVPWQLLAKINGIPDPDQLIPGEHVKLVQGPIDAVVSVSRGRLSLQVAGHYAGSFPAVIGRAVTDRVGASVAVVDVRSTGAAGDPAARRTLVLADGMAIEAVDDPAAHASGAVGSTVLVASRDFAELVEILGPGSHVLVRR
ncbi:MAG: LysM peptidoglycan-binding domain-containing protein [Planctomycetes bacterium]|nr:LysM peptidoglycan-binding domain-containing protein [Planctomycetota bacterium]